MWVSSCECLCVRCACVLCPRGYVCVRVLPVLDNTILIRVYSMYFVMYEYDMSIIIILLISFWLQYCTCYSTCITYLHEHMLLLMSCGMILSSNAVMIICTCTVLMQLCRDDSAVHNISVYSIISVAILYMKVLGKRCRFQQFLCFWENGV